MEGRANVIRLLIADDQTVFRKSLRMMLETYEDMLVVGDVSDGFDAVSKARELRPQVVLMDIRMPGCDGIKATERIVRELPEVRVMMLTTYESEPEIIYQALSAGAVGYVPKTSDLDELIDAIRAIARGEVAIGGPAMKGLVGFIGGSGRHATSLVPPRKALSAREREVLGLVAEGLSNREIGERLTISENTVHSHIRKILEKLNLSNRVQLATYALKSKES